MKIDFEDIRFGKPTRWINDNLNEGKNLEQIQNPFSNEEEFNTISMFLHYQKVANGWDINDVEWISLVNMLWTDYQKRVERNITRSRTVIISPGEQNQVEVPTSPFSSWVKYKGILENNGFTHETVSNIESDSNRILRQLSLNTIDSGSIKGLVVGSVQSGKTTNMAALMSMAADAGWNVFIVLTGMIEKLRVQTRDRLNDELSRTNGSVQWVSVGEYSEQKLQNIDFNNNQKVLITSLKQKQRLEQLIRWLSSDGNKADSMRVLIIDDEADQASIDTADIDETERKTINNLIVNLVNNCDSKGKKLDRPLKAINYVGYTATPYANVLNESSTESLYPKDFVALLSQSRSYIGPSQIFGIEGEEQFPGIDIVRNLDVIDPNELESIKMIHDGESFMITEGLKESISYFIAAAASLRLHNFGKPVSMLVHTSNFKIHHEYVCDVIVEWLKSNQNEVVEQIRHIWERETHRFNIEDFKRSNPSYEQNLNRSLIPHSFYEIEEEVKNILRTISPIGYEEGNLVYHEGMHYSIDNSDHNNADDNDYLRLVYPDSSNKNVLSKTPIFMVVGGNTLSRGITIDGLVSTYFLRSSAASDTLMQMGRWFGFRIKYELYPRIWMTDKTINEFEYLSILDHELRGEIHQHNAMNLLPTEVGFRLRTSPQNIRLMLTAKNKSQSAITSEFDFTGASIQTTTFDKNIEMLQENLDRMEDFIDSLGTPIINERNSTSSVYWENIDFFEIKKFIEKYNFSKSSRVSSNISSLLDWNTNMYEKGNFMKWNVIAIGVGKANEVGNDWVLKNFSFNKVNRSKLSKKSIIDDIRLKVLRGPGDLYKDIDLTTIDNKDLIEKIKRNKTEDYIEIREELGLQNTPQLMLYRVDQNSPAAEDSRDREDLNSGVDIAGLYISIPGSKTARGFATHLTIELPENKELDYDELETEL